MLLIRVEILKILSYPVCLHNNAIERQSGSTKEDANLSKDPIIFYGELLKKIIKTSTSRLKWYDGDSIDINKKSVDVVKKQDQCIAMLFDNLKIDLSQEKVLPLCLFLFLRHITPISLNKKLNFKRSSHVL